MPERVQTHWLTRLFWPAAGSPRPSETPRFTAAEVKEALRRSDGAERTRRVHECVARLGIIIDDFSARQRFRGLEDYHRRMLRILTLYCRGWETEAIASSLSRFSTAVGVECAIDRAALLIAEHLNQRQAA
jgi:hypothetical protein